MRVESSSRQDLVARNQFAHVMESWHMPSALVVLLGIPFFLYICHCLFVPSAPLAPHPPLLLARRPNRGCIGVGGWTPSYS